MEKIIEIPEGYEARIEGNKVVLEQKESEDEKIRKSLIHHFMNKTKPYWNGLAVKDIIAYFEKQKEQKPAEWSEEDEKMLEQAIKCVNNSGKLEVSTEEIEDWLNSLRPYRHREEDYVRVYEPRPGTMIRAAVRDAIEEAKKGNECLILRFSGVCLSVEKDSNPNTLEAMYYRRWKPSEEQMSSLWQASIYYKSGKIKITGEQLESLYNDLKKLK